MIIGIGTDLIEVSRIKRSISKPAFLEKIYTQRELELCDGKQSRAQSLAARFAAKEACLKALGIGWSEGLSFRDIEILNDSKGAPELHLSGKSQTRAEELGAKRYHVTLSHLKEIASATVILEK